MSAGPSEMPAASETSISTRDMVEEGEEEEEEKEKEKETLCNSNMPTKTAGKSLLSTKGSETERGAFYRHHRAV